VSGLLAGRQEELMATTRAMTPDDWPAVRAIYEDGIATGHATFQTSAPSWDEWNADHLTKCRLVAEEDERIVGWAALTEVSGRCVYAGVAEISVCVSSAARTRHRAAYWRSWAESNRADCGRCRLVSFPKTPRASPFTRVRVPRRRRREKLGQMNGVWRDVLLLERRSGAVGAL
jgi:phosphinothricin acetyltransferase